MMKKIFSVVFLMLLFISGCSKKEAALPYNFKSDLLWPYLNKQIEDAKRNEFAVYKKNKVREIISEDTAKQMRIVTQINKEGYPISSLTFSNGILQEETQYEYDSKGVINLIKTKASYRSKSDSVKNADTKNYDILYKYNDGLPISLHYKDSLSNYTAETVYEDRKLQKVIGVSEMDQSKYNIDKEVSYSGDTIFVNEDGTSAVKHFTFIDKKDTLYSYGYYGDKKRIFKEGRFIFIGNETSYIKYFYKDNGLVDYTLERWSTTPEYVLELKMTRRYFFYDN